MGEKLTPSDMHQIHLFYSKKAILDHCWWSRCKFWLVTFIEVIWDHLRSPTGLIANNSLLKNVRDMAVVSLCLSCRDASTDMQHDILGSKCDLTWSWSRVKCWPNRSKLSYICFDAPWREEHDDARNMWLGFLFQKLFAKTFLSKLAFLPFVDI